MMENRDVTGRVYALGSKSVQGLHPQMPGWRQVVSGLWQSGGHMMLARRKVSLPTAKFNPSLGLQPLQLYI